MGGKGAGERAMGRERGGEVLGRGDLRIELEGKDESCLFVAREDWMV